MPQEQSSTWRKPRYLPSIQRSIATNGVPLETVYSDHVLYHALTAGLLRMRIPWVWADFVFLTSILMSRNYSGRLAVEAGIGA